MLRKQKLIIDLTLTMAGFWTILSIIAPSEALAYIDPGTGSFVFQFAIAGILGLSYSFRSFFKTIWQRLTRKKTTPETREDELNNQAGLS